VVLSLTKELVLWQGKQLSYQLHGRRSEVWTVVSGFGKVVLDGSVQDIAPGKVIVVPANVKHAVFAETETHIIEEDSERFGNYWED
jgi:mannose-1-phosphate guanylyltransferase